MYGRGTLTTKTLFETIERNRETLHHVTDGMPVNQFKPLRSWPAHAHTRQEEIDTFKSLPSRYA